MIEEYGVHGLTYVVVATERERQVADTAAHVGSGQMLPNPAGGTYEVQCVCVMLLHTRCYRQYVGVEDNVDRIHANLLSKKPVCTLRYLYTALVAGGLSLFVEAHHHDGGTIALAVAGMLQEHLLAFLQRDAVDDALALHTLQTGGDDVPFRRVDHHRHTGYVGLGSYHIEEGHHLLTGIEQTVVHVDIDDQCTVLHLFAGYADSLVVALLLDQAQELPGASHVAALTDVDKGSACQQIQPRQP